LTKISKRARSLGRQGERAYALNKCGLKKNLGSLAKVLALILAEPKEAKKINH
jgi:hypothetical protein